jgi:hypothetical protein
MAATVAVTSAAMLQWLPAVYRRAPSQAFLRQETEAAGVLQQRPTGVLPQGQPSYGALVAASGVPARPLKPDQPCT